MKEGYGKTEIQNNICINVLLWKWLTYPVYLSDQKLEDFMNFLLMTDENKSHYVYIKDFNRFMCNKTKNKNKKYFFKCCLQCFSSEKVDNTKRIAGKQSVKLKSGSISFKNYFKQVPVPFKIYADFECILKGIKSSGKNNGHTLKNIQIIFFAVLLTKLFLLIIINSVKKLFVTEKKMLLTSLLKQFLKSMIIIKK